MSIFDKYSDATSSTPSIDELVRELMSLADWIDDPSAAPIEERRRWLPKARRLAQEIRARRREKPMEIIIQIYPAGPSEADRPQGSMQRDSSEVLEK